MNIEELRDYCIRKKGVTESFPFNQDVLVFKVMGKMYALLSLKAWEEGNPTINLKCDPEKALILREQYESIYAGYHMNKKHWNTIALKNGTISKSLLKELMDHSYDVVVQGLPRKVQEELRNIK
ncbi:MmcQ/YjbR family DNA-binding protein [Leptobacterium sp. I13]|uniref:MmcQ/YjbR family DNA-binding protein n=1 Tax=Leptobacterium meishanense TaxID=3128904 RepID=UPI0030EB22E4